MKLPTAVLAAIILAAPIMPAHAATYTLPILITAPVIRALRAETATGEFDYLKHPMLAPCDHDVLTRFIDQTNADIAQQNAHRAYVHTLTNAPYAAACALRANGDDEQYAVYVAAAMIVTKAEAMQMLVYPGSPTPEATRAKVLLHWLIHTKGSETNNAHKLLDELKEYHL